jgi:hypothetical protein
MAVTAASGVSACEYMKPLFETIARNERFNQFLLESRGCAGESVPSDSTFPHSDRGLPTADRSRSTPGGGDWMTRLKSRVARAAAALAALAALAWAGGAMFKW